MLKPEKRTGMSDAHLRPDLKAQNPLYARSGTSRSAFDHERCPLNARVLADQDKTEAERRLDAMARGERHIIVPASFEAFIARRKPAKIKHEEPRPTLKPSWAVRRANRFRAFQTHTQNKENTMSEGPPGRSNGQGQAPEIVRRDGVLRGAAWQENGEYGPFFNTKISRSYKDRDGEIQETTSLREKDLLPAAELAREMHQAIRAFKRDRTQSKEQNREDKHTEIWHDDEMTRDEINRESFKKSRSPNGKRHAKPRDRKAR